jgi:translation initiation factor IF-1
MKQESLCYEGTVLQELGNSMFKVALDIEGEPEILCTISGKIRKNYIRILAGDRVKVEMSPYDLTKGRISTRLKTPQQEVYVANKNNNQKRKK